MKVQPRSWFDFAAPVLIDLARYEEATGRSSRKGLPPAHTCPHCRQDTALTAFDTVGELWFLCSKCQKMWTLADQVRAVMGFDLPQAAAWLKQNEIVSGDAEEYVALADKKRKALDWFEESRQKGLRLDVPETLGPGEWGMSVKPSLLSLMNSLGKTEDYLKWGSYYIQMVRSFSGTPGKIKIYHLKGGMPRAIIELSFCDVFAGGSFVDGVLWGETTSIVSRRFVMENGLPVVPKPLMIPLWGNYNYPTPIPPWRRFELISSSKTFEEDIFHNISILNGRNSRVQLDGKTYPLDDVVVKHQLWQVIICWGVVTSNLSEKSLERILRSVVFYRGGTVEEHRDIISDMAEESSHRFTTDRSFNWGQMLRTDDCKVYGRIRTSLSSKPEASGDAPPIKKPDNLRVTNFTIHVLERDKSAVKFVMLVGGRDNSVSMTLPPRIFDDTNLLYPRLVSRALSKKMPTPLIYKTPRRYPPAYPKNLIQHAR